MTLDEAFARYRGYQLLKRRSPTSDTIYTMADLKRIKKRAVPEAQNIGFYVSPALLEDLAASDWETVTAVGETI